MLQFFLDQLFWVLLYIYQSKMFSYKKTVRLLFGDVRKMCLLLIGDNLKEH